MRGGDKSERGKYSPEGRAGREGYGRGRGWACGPAGRIGGLPAGSGAPSPRRRARAARIPRLPAAFVAPRAVTGGRRAPSSGSRQRHRGGAGPRVTRRSSLLSLSSLPPCRRRRRLLSSPPPAYCPAGAGPRMEEAGGGTSLFPDGPYQEAERAGLRRGLRRGGPGSAESSGAEPEKRRCH